MGIMTIDSNNKLSSNFRLTKRNELVLYRIIHELIYNSIKHAQSTEARAELSQSDTELKSEVADNGIGLTTEHENQGLYTIRERSNTIGGVFDIRSKEKSGSVATLIIETGT